VTSPSIWLFADPPGLAVLATRRIVREDYPILCVFQDEDDGGWQFLDGGDVDEEVTMVVLLASMMMKDPGITELAELPRGWRAWRAESTLPWEKSVSA